MGVLAVMPVSGACGCVLCGMRALLLEVELRDDPRYGIGGAR